MMIHLLMLALSSVTHAQGWSYPVLSIDVPDENFQRKDLVVTGTDNIHQIWNKYGGDSRVGYNVILSDGTPVLSDRMLSNDTWASYVSISRASDSTVIALWRENHVSLWYSVMDTDGNTLIPPSLYSTEGWYSWPLIDSSPDSLGRIHLVRSLADGSVCYSVLEPGVGELFRDTIPDSHQQSLIVVEGDHVHIKYNKGWPDDNAMYIQYDLDGNVVIPPVSLVDEEVDQSNRCSMTLDSDGNAMVFLVERPSSINPSFLSLYKIDRSTGTLLIDQKAIYQPAECTTLHEPVILPGPDADSFYLLWGEGELGGSTDIHYIKFAVIDSEGNFTEEPYVAYDYSDENPQELQRIAADVNSAGDVFVHWSAYFREIESFYIVLGWFDHTWVSVERNAYSEAGSSSLSVVTSSNPFTEQVEVIVTGGRGPLLVRIFDLQGRLVRELSSGPHGSMFLWDGRDSIGNEVPEGSYLVRVADDMSCAAAMVIKLE